MKAVYRQVLTDLETRIEQLQATHAVVSAIAGGDAGLAIKRAAAALPKAKRLTRGRAPRGAANRVTGTDAIVLEVITGGADTLKAIADGARVKRYSAAQAIRRLEQIGKVKREGATCNLRYLPTKG